MGEPSETRLGYTDFESFLEVMSVPPKALRTELVEQLRVIRGVRQELREAEEKSGDLQ